MNRELSDREWQVAECLAFGLVEKEVAERLDISINTVKAHKRNIYNKVGLRNNSDMTRYYIQETSGISLDPPEKIKKLVSVFLLALMVIMEFSATEFVRLRSRIRIETANTKVIRARFRNRGRETHYLLYT